MKFSLWIKFLLLLLAVSVIALSSAFFLRELMIKDFREYLEGEMEDRVYWVTAEIERDYEKHAAWKQEALVKDIIWALMLGLEIRIKNANENIVIDTEQAISALSPLIRQRIIAISDLNTAEKTGFVPYPLFLRGKEIGILEVQFLRQKKDHIFIDRSNRFLLFSLLTVGGLAVILSIIFSRRMVRPIKNLSDAAKKISEGNLTSRVSAASKDEIGRLAETFNTMAKNLETQETLRRKLISNVAHELRTPLSAMKGELEAMIDKIIPFDRKQLQSLHDETGRLKHILDGIDELTQAQASALFLKKQQIELKPFLKNIMERFSRQFSGKGIAFELNADEITAYADPDRLSQIIINLLSNALNAAGKGGNVLIRAGKQGRDPFIEIKDNGCGIKAEDLPFIFERFFRVSDTGLGLGLAIVKELVEAHNGRIEVKSEFGKGSTFTVIIPS